MSSKVEKKSRKEARKIADAVLVGEIKKSRKYASSVGFLFKINLIVSLTALVFSIIAFIK